MSPTQQLLAVKNLSFKFDKNNAYFLHDLSFTCQQNHLYVLHGHNGAGKSTLFRLLHNSINPNEFLTGVCTLGNHRIDLGTAQERKTLTTLIKHVPQQSSLMLATNLSVSENLRMANLPTLPHLKHLPQNIAYTNLITHFGVDLQMPVHLLSGGQQQLLAILMALQKSTKVLLLDEPTAALDPTNSKHILQFLDELIKEIPIVVIMISHQEDIIKKYAHNSLELIIQPETKERRLVQT